MSECKIEKTVLADMIEDGDSVVICVYNGKMVIATEIKDYDKVLNYLMQAVEEVDSLLNKDVDEDFIKISKDKDTILQ